MAFEPQHRQQGLEGIIDIGAVFRRRAARDQEQPLQLEGMVDADRAGMAHVGGHQRAERGEALRFERQRMERRQTPVLALGAEQIGRRADRQARREPVGMRPNLRATGIAADGEIAIEADLHAGTCRRDAPARRAGDRRGIAAIRGSAIRSALSVAKRATSGEAWSRKGSGHSPSQERPCSRNFSEIASKVA